MKKSYTKADEIKALESLKEGHTYFSAEFSKSDVDIMILNIKNDFPLLHGTSYDSDRIMKDNFEKANASMKVEIETLKEMELSTERRIDILEGTIDEYASELLVRDNEDNFVYGNMTMARIIKLKIYHRIDLVEKDRTYIRENLK